MWRRRSRLLLLQRLLLQRLLLRWLCRERELEQQQAQAQEQVQVQAQAQRQMLALERAQVQAQAQAAAGSLPPQGPQRAQEAVAAGAPLCAALALGQRAQQACRGALACARLPGRSCAPQRACAHLCPALLQAQEQVEVQELAGEVSGDQHAAAFAP